MMIDRRTFIQQAAIFGIPLCGLNIPATCSAFSSKSTSPGTDVTGIQFGFSLYGMRSLSLADAVTACATIGYDSVELVATAGWPCDPATFPQQQRQELRKKMKDLGLGLPSIMENLQAVVDQSRHRQNLDRIKAACQLGHEMSPDAPPVIETVIGGKPADWDTKKGEFVARLGDWAKVAQAEKTIVAIKAHVGGALHTPHDAKWLVNQIGSPWLKLNYDYSHFQLYDFELKNSLETLLPETVFIHIKDTRGKAADFRFLLPGDGTIDYESYFEILRASNYHGGVMVEVSGQIHGQRGYDPVKAAKHSFDKIAPTLTQAGLWKSAQ